MGDDFPMSVHAQRRWALRCVPALLVLLLLALSPHAVTLLASQDSLHPTFARDIAPIVYRNCATCHHSSEPGALCGTNAFPLLSYEDVKQHASAIVAVTRRRIMPPWLPEPGYGDFADDHRLSDAQIRLISEWVRDGAPAGTGPGTTPAPRYSEGWQLGQPDMILESSRPLSIPASGPDVFWNFVFSPGDQDHPLRSRHRNPSRERPESGPPRERGPRSGAFCSPPGVSARRGLSGYGPDARKQLVLHPKSLPFLEAGRH